MLIFVDLNMIVDHVNWKEKSIDNQKWRIENISRSHKELFKLQVVPVEPNIIVKNRKRQYDVIFNVQLFTWYQQVFT